MNLFRRNPVFTVFSGKKKLVLKRENRPGFTREEPSLKRPQRKATWPHDGPHGTFKCLVIFIQQHICHKLSNIIGFYTEVMAIHHTLPLLGPLLPLVQKMVVILLIVSCKIRKTQTQHICAILTSSRGALTHGVVCHLTMCSSST